MFSLKTNCKIDVLVVGAGPTGLTAALELVRRDVAVRVIEKRSERQLISKALVVQARTLEIMDIAGLAGTFVRRGYPAPGLNVSLGLGKQVAIELEKLDTRFPYLLVLPQNDTEEILESGFKQAGGSVERDIELIGIDQTDRDGVFSKLRLPDGREKSVRSQYLIGCDGAHSTVRQTLNLPFEGKQHEAIVFLADVKLNAEFVKSRITNFTSRRGFVSILPFLGEYARIFAVDFTKQNADESDELDLSDLQETVDAIVSMKLTLSEPRWITRFCSPSRQVPVARVGNVFLAGDAAHAHSPAGGQGMNAGMQDAFNLGWKLAMVLRKEAPSELLASYDGERHSVDARIQRQTDLMFETFLLRNPLLKAARDIAAAALVHRKLLQRKLAGDLSNVSINYRHTKESRASRSSKLARNAIQAGDRVPDVDLWATEQPDLRLYELLREGGYGLFAYVSATRLSAERNRLTSLLQSLSQMYGETIRPYVVCDEGVPEMKNANGSVVVDFKGQFRRKLGAESGSVLLTRPDGYLALHHLGFDFQALSGPLGYWIRQRI
ncbi:MAG: FAD-dependent monooxygenase [Verrucomicrobia bacterium]|nr:FAD-dependent monooxygenase [Verrucomicrobiota bacterium]